jgi:uncharacterized protein YndB with AHSA1/START domain
MLMNATEQTVQTLELVKEEQIAAPIDIVFETILEQMGPGGQTPDGTPLPMKLEAWPGGRWFRDLGNGMGHLWGHVQSIKAPVLLEIQGPLFMSSPVISHVKYRLTEQDGRTRVEFSHRAVGLIAPEYRDGPNLGKGWDDKLAKTRAAAEQRSRENKGGR